MDTARALDPEDNRPGPPESAPSGRAVTRRATLAGFGAITLSGAALTACEVDQDAEPEAGPLTTADEIPVGGGTIFEDQNVVVTQPTEGEFRGFSATCTHQGCTVSEVADGAINCQCHGSSFAIEDASVVGGPANEPLGEVELAVDGDEISIA